MRKCALVLEGGAFRGVFTSGVLDAMIDDGLVFETVIGVSAGALTGTGYVAKQKGFSKNVNLGYRKDSNYVGLKALYKEKSVIGFNYLFDDITKNKVPFDLESFKNSPQKFYAVATCVETGETVAFEKSEVEEPLKTVRASSSIPIMTRPVKIGNKHYVDGGVRDCVAFDIAEELGYDKIVVVLTKPIHNRSKTSALVMRGLKEYFHKYPKMIEACASMDDSYNSQRAVLEYLWKKGKVFIIVPKKPIVCTNLEDDIDKMEDFYLEGYDCYYEAKDALLEYLDK